MTSRRDLGRSHARRMKKSPKYVDLKMALPSQLTFVSRRFTPKKMTHLHVLLRSPTDPKNSTVDKIRFFVSQGVELDGVNQLDQSPLYVAVESRKDYQVIEYLLNSGASVNGHGNSRPVVAALRNRDVEMVDYLINHGATVNFRDERGNGALHLALKFFEREDRSRLQVLELLLSFGADVNAVDASGATALTFAVDSRDPELFHFLLKRGAAIDGRDSEERSLLYNAVVRNFYEAARALIELGADVNDVDFLGDSVLSAAILNANVDIVRLLLESGAEVNEDEHLVAAATKSLEVLMMLVAQGAQMEPTYRFSMFANVLKNRHWSMLRYVAENLMDVAKMDERALASVLTPPRQLDKRSSEDLPAFAILKQMRLLVEFELVGYGDTVLRHVRTNEVAYDYYGRCRDELRLMRELKVCDESDMTYYDFLSCRQVALAEWLRNDQVVATLKYENYNVFFPIHAVDVRDGYALGLRRLKVVDEYCEAVHDVLGAHLAKDLVYRIIEFLDVAEIEESLRKMKMCSG